MKVYAPEIKRAIKCLGHELFEVRILESSKSNYSGYFTDADVMIDKLERLDSKGQVYINLNSIKNNCYSREQHDVFKKNAANTTKDVDIEHIDFVFIDLDPERSAGTSSTKEELIMANNKALQVMEYMKSKGFYEPIRAMSGNGVHLLYHVDLTPDKSGLVKGVLQTLDFLFSDNSIKIDVSVANPARIIKLYGTKATKGFPTEERPHRTARIVNVGDVEKINEEGVLKSVISDLVPQKSDVGRKRQYTESTKEFDLDTFLDNHSIGYDVRAGKDCDKYILDSCPFCGNKSPDSAVFKFRNGGLCFKCFHNSCADKKWEDFRMFYEPDCYERKQNNKKCIPNRLKTTQEVVKTEESEVYSLTDIANLPDEIAEYIPTGIKKLDEKIRGLRKGELTILTGLRAAGKSSILSQIIAFAADNNYKSFLYTGEMKPKNVLMWLERQICGKPNLVPTKFENYFVPKNEASLLIENYYNDLINVYRNTFGNEQDKILGAIENRIKKGDLDLVIIDNLMTINICNSEREMNIAQTNFVQRLSDFAKAFNVHVILVAHPRKPMGMIRIEDISGTGNISNLADNVFLLHRVNNDFIDNAKRAFKWKDGDEKLNASGVLEVAKNREEGVCDYFIPLYYEPETKRLKNDNEEAYVYKCFLKDGFGSATQEELEVFGNDSNKGNGGQDER